MDLCERAASRLGGTANVKEIRTSPELTVTTNQGCLHGQGDCSLPRLFWFDTSRQQSKFVTSLSRTRRNDTSFDDTPGAVMDRLHARNDIKRYSAAGAGTGLLESLTRHPKAKSGAFPGSLPTRWLALSPLLQPPSTTQR